MPKRKPARPTAKPQAKITKTDQLKSLLAHPEGLTAEALSQKLSWQTHTTRAALTRLKQAGVKVEKLEPSEGSRHARYRIAGGTA